MNQPQQYAIAYLVEENRVLRQQIGHRRMRFTDDQRRRLAAKTLRAKWLSQIAKCERLGGMLNYFREAA